MNHKVNLQQIAFGAAALFLVALAIVMGPRLSQMSGPAVGPGRAAAPVADTLAGEQAAPAADAFDYEQAADNAAARWIATGKGYERLGLLNKEHVAPGPLVPGAVVLGMAEALNAGDLEGMLAFWADDANFYIYGLPPNGGELVAGKEALRAEFASEIEAHQRLETEIRLVRGDIVTTREKTWHDFTRQLGVAPLEAAGVYQIADGKIANYAWTLTKESADRLKAAFYEAMPPEETAAAEEAAAVTPVSEITVVFADGTCRYDGPLALQAGNVLVTMEVQDTDREKYAFSLFTLDEGKDFIDLMVSTVNAGPPSWAHMILLKGIQPGGSKTAVVTLKEGPVYAVCWSQPPDIPVGSFGPLAVVE